MGKIETMQVLEVSVFLKFCVFHMFMISSYCQGNFEMPPESINATLNSTVTFMCRTNLGMDGSTATVWKINELFTPSQNTNDETELEVFCSEDLDMANITCGVTIVIENSLMDVFSDPALLRIQGLLGPVTDLMVVKSTPISITLTWDPPSSLDITGVDPDFTHTVEVYNITSGGRQEVGVYENITDSIFTFTLCENSSQSNDSSGDGMNCILVNSDPSDLFEFIITAVNAVGRGDPSEVNATFFQAPTNPPTLKPVTTEEMTSIHTSDNIQTPSSMVSTTVNPTTVNPTTGSSSSTTPTSGGTVASTVVVVIILSLVFVIAVLCLIIAIVIVIVVLRRRRMKTIKVHRHAPTQLSCYEEIPPHVFNESTHHNNAAPAVNQNGNAAKDEGISMYVTAQELDLKSGGQHPGPSDTNVVYSEVPKHLNPKNLIYEHVDVKPASKTRPVDDQFTVVYSDLKTVAEKANDIHVTQQHQQPCSEQTPSGINPSTSLTQLFTRENLLSALSPVTHKWRKLGLQLEHGIDEDRIDEFDTNNETDDGCLEEMMDYYFTNVHFEHTWEEICGALREIGEEGLAEKIARS